MANKKINQLVAKTTIQSTDLFPLGDATTGQLFKKTIADLQAAIGGAVISVNGLTGALVLDTDDIQELASPTNRYFTEARSRAAISLTTTGSSGASTYSSSTGVLNVPTYTLAGLGGIGASFLSGGTGITYNSGTGVISYSGTVYTDASVRGLVSAGTGLSYNSSTGVFSYSGTVYTDSSIRALISLTTTGSSGAATYNNTTGVINVPNYTLAGLGGISLTSLSGSAPITYNSSTGAIGITQATTSTNGYLSATDWNTFNGKQSALTLGNVTESVSNVLMFPDGGTNKTIGNLSIQVVQAGSTSSGYLSTTDWNTFNNKQNAITLTTTGTSGAATFSGGTLNIPQYQGVLTNPVTGTGTSGYVAYWNGSGTLTGAAGHFWDNTNTRLGLGTSSPETILNIVSGVRGTPANTGTSAANASIRLRGVSNGVLDIGELSSSQAGSYWLQVHDKTDQSANYNLSLQPNGGQVLIGGINTAGYAKLEVYGSKAPSGYDQGILNVQDSGGYSAGSGGSISFRGIYTSANDYVGGAQIDAYKEDSTSGNYGYSLRFLTRPNGAGIAERMRITSGGNIGIGESNPAAYWSAANKVVIYKAGGENGMTFVGDTNHTATIAFAYGITGSDRYRGYIQFYHSNNNMYFGNSGTDRMIIAGSGNILMGTSTDNGERLYVSGSIRATGSITANSDARLKKNIERIENALQKVSEISGYTYNTIYDEDRHAGVIAQEIDKVLPEIVNKGNDGLMGVEYGNISALLIEAIKDLKKDNESLRAIVEGLRK